MCYHPIRIKRPGYDAANMLHSKWCSFPCRKCKECRDILASEYAFRVQQETFRCLDSKGLLFFNTFTYDDWSLPRLWYKDSSKYVNISTFVRPPSLLNPSSITTWNKKHIQKYVKRLRRFISYYFGVNSNSLRYFITCERGSDRQYKRTRKDGTTYLFQATSRPHYHSIFWIYNCNIECLIPLPDWCNGLVMLKDVLPLAFKHFWSYGFLYDCKLSRTPAVASKYVTKYITKQSDDKLNHIDFGCFISHNHDIDFKDMRPFFLSSNGIGASYVPSFDELSGLKKVPFESTHKASSISLPRYYIKKYLKQDVCLGVKSQELHKRTWTSKDGYVKSHILQYNDDSDSFPIRVSQKSNELGERVDVVRYSSKVLDFFNELCSFVKCPDTFLRLSNLYNTKVHEKINQLEFRFLHFHEIPENLELVEDRQIVLSQQDYDRKYHDLDLDEFAHWLDEVDAINQTDKTYLYYEPSIDPRKALVQSLEDSIYLIASLDASTILDNITQYYHFGVDSADDVLIALQTLDYYFGDCKLLKNSLKRYVADCIYHNNLSQVMIDYPDLFSPIEIDEYFSQN